MAGLNSENHKDAQRPFLVMPAARCSSEQVVSSLPHSPLRNSFPMATGHLGVSNLDGEYWQ